jgi:hypothetical protein
MGAGLSSDGRDPAARRQFQEQLEQVRHEQEVLLERRRGFLYEQQRQEAALAMAVAQERLRWTLGALALSASYSGITYSLRGSFPRYMAPPLLVLSGASAYLFDQASGRQFRRITRTQLEILSKSPPDPLPPPEVPSSAAVAAPPEERK